MMKTVVVVPWYDAYSNKLIVSAIHHAIYAYSNDDNLNDYGYDDDYLYYDDDKYILMIHLLNGRCVFPLIHYEYVWFVWMYKDPPV